MNALIEWNGKQLDLIRRTVAKDTNADEFEQFVHICRHTKLDPLKRQAFCFVFNKANPAKRQMVIVTSIGGYRTIASRTGNYRPGLAQTIFNEAMKDPSTNPQGVEYGECTVYQYLHGEWHGITERAYWTEFAPLSDDWVEGEDGRRRPSGKPKLDPKKEGWHRMPRVMIEKCAEAKALRRAWPDDFEGLYSEDEIDKTHSLQEVELSATELADKAAEDSRMQRIGGRNALTVDWCDGGELQRIPAGQFGDKVIAFVKSNKDEPLAVLAFTDRNRHTLKEYWALDPGGALEVKKVLEPYEAQRPKKAG